ncbi:MAG: ABC transporter permease, partial [Proteobacteria bacterium]|nr:ABC transporter permease [Burkholderiales bacterium]
MNAMRFMPVLLWTDVLVLVLLLSALTCAVIAWRSETLRESWRKVARSATGVGSAVVLGVFLLIGLADSLHFRPALPGSGEGGKVAYAVDVLSVLDLLAQSLRERRERTYSAPLAAVAFQKEAIERDGVQVREFPRLQFGGAHLADPVADWRGDVVRRV